MTAKGLRRSLDSIDNEWSASPDDASDAPNAEEGSAPPRDEWKVNVEGREIVGMTAAEVVAKLRSGELSGQSLAWRDGMEDWTAIDALPVFALAAPVSSRPAASEARPKVSEPEPAEDMTVKRAPQRTEVGLQPPTTAILEAASTAFEAYDPEGATSVRVLPEVPLDEQTVIIHEPATLPPPPPGADEVAASGRGEDLAGALAVYERPIATLAFPELDAPSDEETVISEPPASTEPPPPAKSSPLVKAEDPPVPPLPKLPSRALVSTAAAAFVPPTSAARSPSGAPRLSSLGPATGARPSSPSSPSITLSPSIAKKPVVPSSPSAPPSRPAPLVEALLSLTDKTAAPPPAAAPPAAPAAKDASPPPVAPSGKVSSSPPPAPSAKASASAPVSPSAKAPSAPPVRVKPEMPVVRFSRQHTPAETPAARSVAPPPPETPTPAVAAAVAAKPAPAVTPPEAPAIPLPADSDPFNEAPPPPPLPAREPPAIAAIAATTTPTIILREDRDADTLITNLRLARSVPLRTAVAGGAVSTLLGSLITGLIVSASQPEPPKAAPPPPAAVVTVTVTAPPPPVPEPPKAEQPAPAPSATEASIPTTSARELAAEKAPKKPKKAATWTPPKPKPTLADPEVALPEDPPAADSTGAEKKPSAAPESADPAADKNKAAWETSPSPGF